ncbi:hypothetical protein BX070DRAFT_219219 [Coemansia spiralis]|nr:hypothetical protein BX070DRAFT_219219 [Coemansia spiralis]
MEHMQDGVLSSSSHIICIKQRIYGMSAASACLLALGFLFCILISSSSAAAQAVEKVIALCEIAFCLAYCVLQN